MFAVPSAVRCDSQVRGRRAGVGSGEAPRCRSNPSAHLAGPSSPSDDCIDEGLDLLCSGRRFELGPDDACPVDHEYPGIALKFPSVEPLRRGSLSVGPTALVGLDMDEVDPPWMIGRLQRLDDLDLRSARLRETEPGRSEI